MEMREELIKHAERIIKYSVGREEIDDFANSVIDYLDAENNYLLMKNAIVQTHEDNISKIPQSEVVLQLEKLIDKKVLSEEWNDLLTRAKDIIKAHING